MSEQNVNIRDLLNVYESECVLQSGKRLQVKPITTGQLKSLLIYENETNHVVIEDALDKIIESSVVTPDFNINELSLQDRMELMLELRYITKGSNYNFTYKCDKCSTEFVVNKDLKDLMKTPIMETELTLDVNDHISIVIGFPTRGNQREAYEFQDVYNKFTVMDSLKQLDIATTTMAYAIKKVMIKGEESDISIEDKIYLLENMPRTKYNEMSDFFKDNNYGIDFEFGFNCINCKKDYKMVLPLNDFFV